MANLNNICK